MRIAVIGTGYVGLVAACCLAKSGHEVIAVEKDKSKLNMLQNGMLPIYEEGLSDIFEHITKDKRIVFSHDLKGALRHVDIAMVTVGTPATSDGRVDLSQVNEVAASIAEFSQKPMTVVMKSTVPPGTGEMLLRRYFSKANADIEYISNPEFLREGKAVWDWYNPDRIVIGSSSRDSANLLAEVYDDIKAPKIIMDITSAEMVKYASNAFLATKISFINEIANLCERVGADIDDVAPAVGMDKRIGKHFLQAGLGYGGSCFPKDTKGLEYISLFNDYDFNLLKAVIEVNAKQRVIAVRKVVQALGGDVMGKDIAVLGLAFKPGTDDVREAPALDIIDHLCSDGAKVNACDPMAIENAKKILKNNGVKFYSNPYEACAGCEAVILATEWPEFLKLNWKAIKESMKPPFVLLDGRNALDRDVIVSYGYKYYSFGRRTKRL